MDYFEEDLLESEVPQEFVIDSDSKAEWALKKIAVERKEADRIITLAEEQIESLEAKIKSIKEQTAGKTQFLESMLYKYFQTVEHKKTKTTEKYKLLSGTLTLKIKEPKAVYNDEDLIDYLKANNLNGYIKTEEKPKWGEYKKSLKYESGMVIDTTTGEVVECIKLEEQPEEFKVEV